MLYNLVKKPKKLNLIQGKKLPWYTSVTISACQKQWELMLALKPALLLTKPMQI